MSKLTPYVIVLFLASCCVPEASSKNDSKEKKVRRSQQAVIWRLPQSIPSRDLGFGPGGKEHQPRAPFVFVEEDDSGSSPKFDVRDANGVIWRVKLGDEARPETAATRLLWAVGYFADEVYLVPKLAVQGLTKLKRGQELVSPTGVVTTARLERKDPSHKKVGEWKWKDNAFAGTRELDGLRVLMALMNNWDLKSSNNAIYDMGSELRYVVSDLGGTFGRTGSSFTRSKGDVDDFAGSKFIKRVSGKGVDFHLASRPFLLTAVYWPYYHDRAEMENVVEDIPMAHVEWIHFYLSQLSPRQIDAAFRAAGYPDPEIASFVSTIRRRIGELRTIRDGVPRYQAKTN